MAYCPLNRVTQKTKEMTSLVSTKEGSVHPAALKQVNAVPTKKVFPFPVILEKTQGAASGGYAMSMNKPSILLLAFSLMLLGICFFFSGLLLGGGLDWKKERALRGCLFPSPFSSGTGLRAWEHLHPIEYFWRCAVCHRGQPNWDEPRGKPVS